MRYQIKGADKTTGAERILAIEAPDEKTAVQKAGEEGVFVSSAQPEPVLDYSQRKSAGVGRSLLRGMKATKDEWNKTRRHSPFISVAPRPKLTIALMWLIAIWFSVVGIYKILLIDRLEATANAIASIADAGPGDGNYLSEDQIDLQKHPLTTRWKIDNFTAQMLAANNSVPIYFSVASILFCGSFFVGLIQKQSE